MVSQSVVVLVVVGHISGVRNKVLMQRWGYTKGMIRYHPHLFSLVDGK